MKTKLLLATFLAGAALSFAAESEQRPQVAPVQNAGSKTASQKKAPTVAEMEADLKIARGQLAEMSNRYMPKHPKMVEMHRKIASLERDIAEKKESEKTVK